LLGIGERENKRLLSANQVRSSNDPHSGLLQEWQQQMEEKKQRLREEKERIRQQELIDLQKQQDYNPFGRAGAGAPNRDVFVQNAPVMSKNVGYP